MLKAEKWFGTIKMKFVLSEKAQIVLAEIIKKRGYDGNENDVIEVNLASFNDNEYTMTGPVYSGEKVTDPEVTLKAHIEVTFNTTEIYRKKNGKQIL